MLNKIKTTIEIIKLFKNWPTFLLCYAGLIKKDDLVLTFRNGLKWHVNTKKRGFAVLGDVWIQKPYSLLDEIENPKIIVDLGGHIGSFSIMAARKYPKSKIYAFEASRENFTMLKKNLAENKIKNVTAFNTGIGEKNGSFDFFINERNTVLNSFIKTRNPENKNAYKVQCKTLSTIFHEQKIKQCDFLKIDIEGLEYNILKTAQKDNMLGRINAIATEIDPNSKDFQKTMDLLTQNKYRVWKNKDIINAVKNK